MLSQSHATALAQTGQYDLGMDLLSRLQRVTSYTERLDILEEAEERFGQLDVRAHAVRVADKARELAIYCGFDEEYGNRLYNATRLHDIGKLFMPTQILEKDGRPTSEEYALIVEHARHGGDLLGPSAPSFVTNVARYHHERFDGKGYNRIVGEDIPVEARLVQVADVYDALRSKRAYKIGLTEESTLESLMNMHAFGVMFDPYFLRRFVEMRLAEDHELQISPEKRTAFEAFARSDPMDDFAKLTDLSIFEGWRVGKDGKRTNDYDSSLNYDVVGDSQNLRGQGPAKPSLTADKRSEITQARGPRF